MTPGHDMPKCDRCRSIVSSFATRLCPRCVRVLGEERRATALAIAKAFRNEARTEENVLIRNMLDAIARVYDRLADS